MNLLFICNMGQNRSRTAAEIFSARFNTKYAGLYSNNVTEQHIEWADIVIVMETAQRTEIGKRFPKQYLRKRIISFDIPDIYHYNQPELISQLKTKINSIL